MVRVVKKDDAPTIVIELEWKPDATIPLADIYDAEYFHIFGFTLQANNEGTGSNDSMLSTSRPPSSSTTDDVSFDNDGNRIDDTNQRGGDKISGPYALLHGIFNSVEKVASTSTISPGTPTSEEIDEDTVQTIYVPPAPIQSTDTSSSTTSGDSIVQLTLTLEVSDHSDDTHTTASLTEYINQMRVANADNIQCFVKSGLDYHTVESIALDMYKQITYLGTKSIEFKDLSLSDVYYICGNYVIVKSSDGFVAKGASVEISQVERYKEMISDMIDEDNVEKRISTLSTIQSVPREILWWL